MINAQTARELTKQVLSSPNQAEFDRLILDAEENIMCSINHGERDTSIRIQ